MSGSGPGSLSHPISLVRLACLPWFGFYYTLWSPPPPHKHINMHMGFQFGAGNTFISMGVKQIAQHSATAALHILIYTFYGTQNTGSPASAVRPHLPPTHIRLSVTGHLANGSPSTGTMMMLMASRISRWINTNTDTHPVQSLRFIGHSSTTTTPSRQAGCVFVERG